MLQFLIGGAVVGGLIAHALSGSDEGELLEEDEDVVEDDDSTQELIFQELNDAQLKDVASQCGVYVGGSNQGSVEAFERYIQRKELTFHEDGTVVKARDAYRFCYYRQTTNAKTAENKLLEFCDREKCPFNMHTRSNVQAREGFAYVLSD